MKTLRLIVSLCCFLGILAEMQSQEVPNYPDAIEIYEFREGSSVKFSNVKKFPKKDFTIAMWIRTTSPPKNENGDISSDFLPKQSVLFHWAKDTYNDEGLIIQDLNKTEVSIGGNRVKAKENTKLTDGVWHHLAVIVKKQERKNTFSIQLYIDATEFELDKKTISLDHDLDWFEGGDIVVGRHSDGSSRGGFSGLITSFIIQDNTLSGSLPVPVLMSSSTAINKNLFMNWPTEMDISQSKLKPKPKNLEKYFYSVLKIINDSKDVLEVFQTNDGVYRNFLREKKDRRGFNAFPFGRKPLRQIPPFGETTLEAKVKRKDELPLWILARFRKKGYIPLPKQFSFYIYKHHEHRANDSRHLTRKRDEDDARYDERTYLMAHNAHMSRGNNIVVNPQQSYKIKDLLNDHGVRALEVDAYMYEAGGRKDIYLYHRWSLPINYYQYSGLKLTDALTDIRRFLDTHPTEIVTLFLETEAGLVIEEKYENLIIEALKEAGVFNMVLWPDKAPVGAEKITVAESVGTRENPKYSYQWPTINSMISSNKRLVIFADNFFLERRIRNNGDDTAVLPFFRKYMVQSAFSDESHFGFNEPCRMDKDPDQMKHVDFSERSLFRFNHFPAVTSLSFISRINSSGRLLAHLKDCVEKERKIPNFIAMDYIGFGDEIKLVNFLNEKIWSEPPSIRYSIFLQKAIIDKPSGDFQLKDELKR